jgi:hypothetical protein
MGSIGIIDLIKSGFGSYSSGVIAYSRLLLSKLGSGMPSSIDRMIKGVTH